MFEVESPQKKVKVLRKITKQRLRNIALYYLKRFESSVANLHGVLMRRINDYAYHLPEWDKSEAVGWVEELLADFERLGYIDDERYAEMKIKAYVNAGKAPRYIQGKMRAKGIDEGVIEELLETQEYDVLAAAQKLARKKKIGPYREDEDERRANRQKDLAKLVQAGFDYDVAQEVLKSDLE